MSSSASSAPSAARAYAELRRRVETVLLEGRRAAETAAIEASWRAGRLIHEHILRYEYRADYGARTIRRLAGDVNVSDRVPYRFWLFGRAYEISPPAAKLTCAHYFALSRLEDGPPRRALAAEAELGLAAILIPNNQGDVWRLISERRLRSEQQARLAALGLFDFDAQGGFRLRDLPAEVKQQIRARLAERRVVQHVPADMSGLRLEENTRGIIRRENGRVFLRQRKKNADGQVVVNETAEWESKVIGLPKPGVNGGKLAAVKGVRVIVDNFGVAILDDAALPPVERFVIIPFADVWRTVRELAARNGGRRPAIWRNGQIIELPKGPRAGRWRIFSIKNTTNMGLVLDLGSVEAVSGSWINVRLKSLLRDGARRIDSTLTGTEVGPAA